MLIFALFNGVADIGLISFQTFVFISQSINVLLNVFQMILQMLVFFHQSVAKRLQEKTLLKQLYPRRIFVEQVEEFSTQDHMLLNHKESHTAVWTSRGSPLASPSASCKQWG